MFVVPTPTSPPKTERELLQRCRAIEGHSFSQLAQRLNVVIPCTPQQRKGWLGQALEPILGATAGTSAEPDFKELGIELKTLPITASGSPAESTYITSIPLLTIHQQQWHTSQCFAKLKRILWVPIEGDTRIIYEQRRVGRAFLWSPDKAQEELLAADWHYLTTQISIGNLDCLDARVGQYLQIRPKAASGLSLCDGFDEYGTKVKTLPRGFYLRSRFTKTLFNLHELNCGA
jgi:DNA mismatch repair protein MutH